MAGALLDQCRCVQRSLLAAVTHVEECMQLAALLESATGVLRQQHNSVPAPSALRLLHFALGKTARIAAACAPGASAGQEATSIPGAAADIELSLSALATALQHSGQLRAVSESGAAPRAYRRSSGAAGTSAFSRAAAASAPPAVLAAVSAGSQSGSSTSFSRRFSAAELQASSVLARTKQQQSKHGSPAVSRRVSGASKQLAHQEATAAVSASAAAAVPAPLAVQHSSGHHGAGSGAANTVEDRAEQQEEAASGASRSQESSSPPRRGGSRRITPLADALGGPASTRAAHGRSAGQQRAEAAAAEDSKEGVKLSALQADLLVPGSVWRLAHGGGGFECGEADEPSAAADSEGGSSSASRTLSQRAAHMAWGAAQAAEAAEEEDEGSLDSGSSSSSSARDGPEAVAASVGAGILQQQQGSEEQSRDGRSCSGALPAEEAVALEEAAARQESSGWPLAWQGQAQEAHAGDHSGEDAESEVSGGPGPAFGQQQEPEHEQAHVAQVWTAGSEQQQPARCSSTASQDSAADTCSPVAQQLLQRGNAAFTTGSYAAAAQAYQAGLDALGSAPGDEHKRLLWRKLSLNLACCHLRHGHLRHCVAACDSLLEVDPGNAVALCHRGRALLLMRVPQVQAAARADLEAALAILSQDGEAAAERPWHDVGYWKQRVLGLLATLE